MRVERNTLIELYKTTLEELRHHDTIYTQAFIGLGIIVPVFLAAIGLLLGSNSPVDPCYFNLVKWGIFVLALLIAGFFMLHSYRMNERFRTCIKVLTEIETRLQIDRRMKGISEFEDLLIRKELNEIKVEKILAKKILGIKLISWRNILAVIVTFVALGFLLFVFIE